MAIDTQPVLIDPLPDEALYGELEQTSAPMSEPRAALNVGNRFGLYARLMRLDKPIGIFLLLWPSLWALWLASRGQPDPWILVVFVLGVVLMRSAGCVINDIADRNIDPHVARTRERPIAAGLVSPIAALRLFIALITAAFLLVLTLNLKTIMLAFVGALLAASYPFMKRFIHLPQAYLGLAFGWGVPMAYAAQTETIPPQAWLLLGVTVLWAMAYDTMYAIADREDDIKIGVKSTAILFGRYDRLIIGIIQVVMLAALIVLGSWEQLRWVYYLGLGVVLGLNVYQQFLLRERNPADCLRAFLNNNWVGVTIFCGLLASRCATPF